MPTTSPTRILVARERDADEPREPRAETIGDPRSDVRLVDRERNLLLPGGKVGGRRGVAAESDDDIDAAVADDPAHVDEPPRAIVSGNLRAARLGRRGNGKRSIVSSS